MTHHLIKRIAATLLLISLNACVYTNIAIPLDNDLDRTQLGSKTGEASSYGILWLVAWGDAGSKAAAENGHITVINQADRKFFSILFGAYTKVTTVVYGD